MSLRALLRSTLLLAVVVLVAGPTAARPASPEEFLGWPVGTDRKLADYHQIVDYLESLEDASDRLTLLRLGETTLENTFVVAVISSAENLRNVERYREIARRLADPRGLTDVERDRLVAEGKVIVLVTLNIHSTEIGASQMAMELAWELAVEEHPEQQRWLEDVILLMVPSLNPDGQIMITEWYREHLGTEFEGGPMPRLYHHYAGHDNNRDWFMLNLAETRLLNRLLYQDWHPHIFVDEHQMGMTGPRLFVPPFKDPPSANVHPLIWRLVDRIGTAMALRAQEAGQAGVIQSAQFDAYWLGGTRNTGWYKNVVGLLTELASVRIATPVFVDPNELRGGLKGLTDYQPQANFPDPWPGGWWRLRDVIDYELVLTRSLLETASRYRSEFLHHQSRMAMDAVEAGREGELRAWAIPSDQWDPYAAAAMLDLLLEHGVEVHRAPGEIRQGGLVLPGGSWVIRADQPYRAFAAEVLARQQYPEVRASTDGPIFLPYDVNNWSLPLLFGVELVELDQPVEGALVPVGSAPYPAGGLTGTAGFAALLPGRGNSPVPALNRLLADGAQVHLAAEPFEAGGRRWEAGTAVVPSSGFSTEQLQAIAEETHVTFHGAPSPFQVETRRVRRPRLALYQGFLPSMDEGWTRLILDRFGFETTSLGNERIREEDLASSFDVIILPDQSRDEIVEGKRSSSSDYRASIPSCPIPPRYWGGYGTL